jgi:dTDP-4-amino-4,6-dideoxygalactose transaminase
MLAEKDIATNVHYKPLPMFTLYKGLRIQDGRLSKCLCQYVNEITLPYIQYFP